ncbi:hypothetical protein CONLIGDRAFT_716848 [Coniochaeta ligniaria NRRL 30616]|uniref:Delta(24)-sterol reductase n=1 Tax=Coniochaeta ligniaria NRRL 30616 TaxID=1408157 RepID=A0A1J7IH40_9PEZI|nr:hypothetical protein CONLIGDRAFT_716848 [Coniochaeta ligniaria NRRL 30616]
MPLRPWRHTCGISLRESSPIGFSSTTVPQTARALRPRRRDNTVDTSSLNRVLDIDVSKKTEPNVPMDTLVAATLKAGLVPLVVMEFPGITVGGGFSGTSGEKDGPFWGAASAFGTLGVATLLEVQLREAKPYVQVTYSLHERVTGANAKIREEIAKEPVDYVDGIMFSKGSTVVCSGRLAERLPEGTRPRRFTRSTDPWFFVHVRRLQNRLRSSASAETTEFVPLVDYLFRYDRGGVWVAKYSFRYFFTPFNRITRFLLDPLMHTRTMYRALRQSGLADYYLVQVPHDKVFEFVDWLHDALPSTRYGYFLFADLEPGSDASWLMNFGIWGPGLSDRREFMRQNRALEQKVQRLGGKKWLYAHTYYTEAEFWAHYDRESYDDVRAKYGAAWMMSVYDKVKVDIGAEERELRRRMPWLSALFWSIWPPRGLFGILMTLLGGDYLLKTANQAQTLKEN